ncbi:Oidioi.mRNA.OKI2018_I69.chr2.g4248.t1.cds [Oikopleura dioica]|uniref:Oidioi.mRNA.OKI2018_I69.chr2.g4248.t1.cds n=1 Tax=Oikopleura dioica TaxID=34765 RepID=A0ABN7SYC7_OIKDI|nr:Oidioi.mRNA.OKI2018_I69.chr2.g4248.t1.cds [Oikopleura dioica]
MILLLTQLNINSYWSFVLLRFTEMMMVLLLLFAHVFPLRRYPIEKRVVPVFPNLAQILNGEDLDELQLQFADL